MSSVELVRTVSVCPEVEFNLSIDPDPKSAGHFQRPNVVNGQWTLAQVDPTSAGLDSLCPHISFWCSLLQQINDILYRL